MAQTQSNLASSRETYGSDHSIIITKELADIPGGITIDVTNWTKDVIPAGTIVYYDSDEEMYHPLELNTGGTAYISSILDSASIVGITKHDIMKKDPRAAVMTQGQVRLAAMPYSPSSYIDDLNDIGIFAI